MILFAIFVVMQIADVWTTVRLLRWGGREENPLVAVVIEAVGALPGLLCVKAGVIAVVWFFVVPADPFGFVLAGLNLFYAMVVAHNLREILS